MGIHDLLVVPVGSPGIESQWHGLPLPTMLGLGATFVAHLWILSVGANVLLGRWRLSRHEWSLLAALCVLLVTFHLLFWVDGRTWRAVLALG
jgi:hypothetical protein